MGDAGPGLQSQSRERPGIHLLRNVYRWSRAKPFANPAGYASRFQRLSPRRRLQVRGLPALAEPPLAVLQGRLVDRASHARPAVRAGLPAQPALRSLVRVDVPSGRLILFAEPADACPDRSLVRRLEPHRKILGADRA